MEVLAIIPARGGSKGVPRKNIRLLGGRPLIDHTFEAVKNAQTITRAVVSTDDAEIAEFARSRGVDAPFLRPPDISGDSAPARAYIAHCLQFLSDQGWRPDITLILQPTTPFRLSSDIDACVRLLETSGADSVVTLCEVPRHFHPKWQMRVGTNSEIELYEGGPLSAIVTRRQDLAPTHYRNGAVYAFRTSVFETRGDFYGARSLAHVMPPSRSVNIDSMEDWEMAESMQRANSIAHVDSKDQHTLTRDAR